MLSVIIPCCDERETIARYDAELFPALDGLGVPYEVLAVDDGSRDGTNAALLELQKKRPLTLLTHPENRGLGAAIRTGLAAAKGEFAAVLDADLSFAPAQLRALLDEQKKTGADLVSGSPYLTPEGLACVPWERRLPSLMLNALYRGLFSMRLTSYTPIFRLYRVATARALPLTGSGFEINAEIAARFVLARKTVAEVPAVLTVRRAGVSKLSRGRELRRHAALIARLILKP